jgi:hypothetical protein
MNRWIVAALLLTGSCAMTAIAQDSPETDEAKFIRLTQQLEETPLSDTDKTVRSWLLQWAIDSQDITVLACNVMRPVPADDVPNSGVFVTQMMFGNAAYQISHPDKREDLLATQLAGVRSALKAYASILAKDPKARIPQFDELLQKDKDRALEAYMAPIVDKECSQSAGA